MAKHLKASLIGVAFLAIGGGAAVTLAFQTAQGEPRPVPLVVTPAREPRPLATPRPAAMPAEDPDAYVVKRVLPIAGPMKFGTWHWDEAGVPAGPGRIVVTVDVDAQVLSIFRDGYEIGTAVILYGSDEKPTPTGVFHVSDKDADHVSNIYDAPMPYMLRLTNDGISIHGSDVRMGYATHGCVGVPIAFAKNLFGAVRKGDRVIVTNGERLQQGAAIKAA